MVGKLRTIEYLICNRTRRTVHIKEIKTNIFKYYIVIFTSFNFCIFYLSYVKHIKRTFLLKR